VDTAESLGSSPKFVMNVRLSAAGLAERDESLSDLSSG